MSLHDLVGPCVQDKRVIIVYKCNFKIATYSAITHTEVQMFAPFLGE